MNKQSTVKICQCYNDCSTAFDLLKFLSACQSKSETDSLGQFFQYIRHSRRMSKKEGLRGKSINRKARWREREKERKREG